MPFLRSSAAAALAALLASAAPSAAVRAAPSTPDVRRAAAPTATSPAAQIAAADANAVVRAGLPAISPQGRRPAVAVIVWHDVLPAKEVWFDTTSADFASELGAISRGGYHVVTLDALYAHLARGAALPARPLVLTFDDDGLGIARSAFPLLRRYGYHATMFVHTNYVGRTTSKHHCSWSDLAAMERSGLVNVQSQTANHPEDLRLLSDSDLAHEFELSRRSIRAHLRHDVDAIAYPYDNFDARVEAQAARHGYRMGFTEDHGPAGDSPSLMAVGRYSVLTRERFDEALATAAG